MESSRIPHLYNLPVSSIEELIFDLRLRKKGARLHFAVDPSEVYDFCFPINPTALRGYDISTIADHQASLYEVFYVRQDPPLLLSDYAFELQRILAFVQRVVNRDFTKAEMVNDLIRAGGLGDMPSDFTDREQPVRLSTEVESILKNDFDVILAVVMGILSLGVDRFSDVMRRLKEVSLEKLHPAIKAVAEAYEGPVMVDIIIRGLAGRREEQSDRDDTKERRRNADLTDAYAIDRLLYLNSALEKAYLEGKLEERHVIIYFSSAPKTQKIFELHAVKEKLPVIEGEPYSFWRTREQIFAYLIHKSQDEDPDKRIAETIASLEDVKRVLEEVQKVGQDFNRCQVCVLNNGTGSACDMAAFCDSVKRLDDQIQKRRQEIYNYGLLKTIDSYDRLLKAEPQSDSHKSYTDFFTGVFHSEIRNIATERMRQLQQMTLIQSEFSNLVPDGLGLSKEGKPAHLRDERDVISGTAQYLPTKPRIKNPRYGEVMKKILNYYKTPPQGDESKSSEIKEAYKDYMEIDSNTDQFDLEHELVRCLLYLAFPNKEGDQKAYDHLMVLLSRSDVMAGTDEIIKECKYVLCWAARRIKEYSNANLYAKMAAESYRDPRFYHGWSLNTYAWLSDEEKNKYCPYKLKDVIEQSQLALALYKENSEEYTEEIGACFNNLACLWAEYAERVSCTEQAIQEARNALVELKDCIPRVLWTPTHPEYLHTEAYVEYQEYSFWNKQGRDPLALIAKLEHAQKAITDAIALVGDIAREKNDYLPLLKKINKALSHHRMQQQADVLIQEIREDTKEPNQSPGASRH
jgi:hypothetical protein